MLEVQWLYTKFRAGQGGILGDDMGLGKTVQSIALVSAVLQKTGELACARAGVYGAWNTPQGRAFCCPALILFRTEQGGILLCRGAEAGWDADVVRLIAAVSCCRNCCCFCC